MVVGHFQFVVCNDFAGLGQGNHSSYTDKIVAACVNLIENVARLLQAWFVKFGTTTGGFRAGIATLNPRPYDP